VQYPRAYTFFLRRVKMTDEELPERLIGERECHQITGLSRAHRWRKERVRDFPLRLSLGPKTVRWRLSEVMAWIEARPRVEGSPKPLNKRNLRPRVSTRATSEPKDRDPGGRADPTA
jgi:prophage regulatory protein